MRTNYSLNMRKGVAGGLLDISNSDIPSRNTDIEGLAFGMGVVVGTAPGESVTLPTGAATALQFEGVVVRESVGVEHGIDGIVKFPAKTEVGCLQKGKAWISTAENAEPAYKEQVFLIVDGDEKGLFTTSDDDSATTIALNAYYLGDTEEGIASALFNYQMHAEGPTLEEEDV